MPSAQYPANDDGRAAPGTDVTSEAGPRNGAMAARRKPYQAPHVYLLGRAAELVRNDATGQRRDGSPSGWWIRS